MEKEDNSKSATSCPKYKKSLTNIFEEEFDMNTTQEIDNILTAQSNFFNPFIPSKIKENHKEIPKDNLKEKKPQIQKLFF